MRVWTVVTVDRALILATVSDASVVTISPENIALRHEIKVFWFTPLGLLCFDLQETRVLRSVCLSVSLSVREHISGTAGLIFTNFFVQISCGRGSVLLWRRCDTFVLPVLWMTSRLAVVGRMAMCGRLNL